MNGKFLISLFALLFLIGVSKSFSQDENLLSNGGFEEESLNWIFLSGENNSIASHSFETGNVKEGQKMFKVIVEAAGVNAWDVQAIHNGWYPMENETYKITLWARAESNGTKLKLVQQNTTYSAKDITLTTSWQKYEWTFTAKESYLQFKLHFFDKGILYIDDIVITGKSLSNIVVRPTDSSYINISKKYQVIEGFGSSLAFYENWIPAHPNKDELYRLAFSDLGLDWLRLRNNYRGEGDSFAHEASEFVEQAKKYRGDSIRVLMCSWTPPSELKDNESLNHGTLVKQNGNFVYDKFAEYWKNSLIYYAKIGVKPDWISIQNEPDWQTDKWETNKFEPKETGEFPGYDKALSAVAEKISTLTNAPKLFGAEMLGIGNNNFDRYNSQIRSNPKLFGYAYHLYNGGDPEFPDSFNPSLLSISKNYSDKPNVMTEYEHRKGKFYKTSWLINNVLTQANATAYFYWDLIWPNSGLIDIDHPWNKSEWQSEKGYRLTPHYYAFKHFSRFIHAGYTRVDITHTNEAIRSSAYLSKDGSSLTIVLINPYKKAVTSTMNFASKMEVKNSQVYQSVEDKYFTSLGKLKANNSILLPAESVTTIVLKISQ